MSLKLPIDRDTFLRDYWQKQPLLMRGALDPGLFSVPPDELAGLACEPDIESRLVIEHGERHWTVEHGPLDEGRFALLPTSHWTLLVQDVDKHRDDVAALLDHFDFVPGWRIDDIMISYATDGGGVGPHTDSYDVFLMQAQGRRRWRISDADYSEDDLLPNQPLRILSSFETTEDWLVAPGDVLYLPPGVAHWGSADGDCMTYSLGFRAPQRQELLAEWLHHCADQAGTAPLVDPDEGLSPIGSLGPGFIGLAQTLCLQPPGDRPRRLHPLARSLRH
jgi:50S ribosomal protein L16 3-hydroxylase